jgi:hypothetical protein
LKEYEDKLADIAKEEAKPADQHPEDLNERKDQATQQKAAIEE